jgi:hypothetical protein
MTITQELIDAERVKFEEAIFGHYPEIPKKELLERKDDLYLNTNTYWAWVGYQAAISQHKAVQDAKPFAFYYESSRGRDLVLHEFDAETLKHCPADMKVTKLYAAPSDNKALVESEPDRNRAVAKLPNGMTASNVYEAYEIGLKQGAATPADTVKQDALDESANCSNCAGSGTVEYGYALAGKDCKYCNGTGLSDSPTS